MYIYCFKFVLGLSASTKLSQKILNQTQVVTLTHKAQLQPRCTFAKVKFCSQYDGKSAPQEVVNQK